MAIINGAEVNDFLTGEANVADAIYGNGGDDILNDGDHANADPLIGANDALYGGAGNDALHAHGGADSLYGGTGNDTFYGGSGANLMFGGDGDDTIYGDGVGGDIDGGAGNDLVQLSGTAVLRGAIRGGGAGDSLVLYGAMIDASSGSATFGGFESVMGNIVGSTGNDVLDLSGLNSIALRGSSLVVDGGDGNDILTGGFEDDGFRGEAGDDQLSGGMGDDHLVGGSGTNSLSGGNGDDFIESNGRYDTIDGGAGNDHVWMQSGTILGGAVQGGSGTRDKLSFSDAFGNPIFDPTSGTATFGGFEEVSGIIAGTGGNDILDLSGLNDATLAASLLSIDGGDGNDRVTGGTERDDMDGEGGNDTLDGGTGDDLLNGGTGTNLLFGGDGNDQIVSIGFHDSIDGGTGDDMVQLGTDSPAPGRAILGGEIRGGAGTNDSLLFYAATFDATSGSASFGGFESVSGALFGTDGKDVVDLSSLDDSILTDSSLYIDGGDGDDRVTGGAERDTLYGAAGDDVLDGGKGDDYIVGGSGTNRLNGGDGNDGIVSDGVDDSIGGGAGDDYVRITSDAIVGGAVDGGSGTGDILKFDDSQFDATSGSASFSGFETVFGNLFGTIGNDVLDLSGLTDAMPQHAIVNIKAGAGNDIVKGGSTHDTIEGGAGNDVLSGGGGVDVASYAGATAKVTVSLAVTTAQQTGGAGTDRLSGFEGLLGSAFNDILTGDAGNNRIDGGAGDDVLNGGLGDDVLVDFSGLNTASYAGAVSAVTVNLRTGTSSGGAGNDSLIGFIFEVIGSSFGDTLIANDFLSFLAGGNGDDLFIAGIGFNRLDGGLGVDTASYAFAESGVTLTLTGPGSAGGGINNSLISIENLVGSTYADVLTGSLLNNAISGGAGDDAIDGGAGSDSLSGGDGVDTLIYASATTKVTASLAVTTAQNTIGSGIDSLSGFENLVGSGFNDMLTGSAVANLIEGRAGNDSINGLAGNDTLLGGDGNDTLQGGDGDDSLDGGAGNDVASYLQGSVGVSVSLLLAGAQATGGAGSDTLVNIEGLTGSLFNDVLTGNASANALNGSNGNDRISGDLGNDAIDGGSGVDGLDYSAIGAGVTVNLGVAFGQNTVGAGTDTIVNVENVIGTAFADTLTGSALGNQLNGGDGNDMLAGGLGANMLNGGAGVDTASYAASTVGVRVNLATTTAQSTGFGVDTLSAIENLTGSAFNDTLSGNGADNVVTGGVGDDILSGAAGNDSLIGGSGLDTASYATAATGVMVSLAITIAQNTIGAGTDTLSSIENLVGSGFADTLTGSAVANTIGGGAGNDVIDGGSGNDIIDGGTGNDILKGAAGDDTLIGGIGADQSTGGAGNDRFVFTAINESTAANSDRILDFAVTDILDLSAIDANTTIAGDDAFHRVATATGAGGEFTLLFNAATNTTTLSAYTNADTIADMAILFTGDVTGLTAGWVL